MKLHFLAGLIGLVALAAVAWVGLQPRSPTAAWILPDGTRLRYVGATYGTNHPSPLRPFWERGLLPSAVVRWLPKSGWGPDDPSPSPALRLWFETDRAFSSESYRWDLSDGSGQEVVSVREVRMTSKDGSTAVRVEYGAFPRSGPTLRLVGHRYDLERRKFETVMELSVPNPSPVVAEPSSRVEARLPQTVTHGPLAFTLVGFETGLARYARGTDTPAKERSVSVARLDFMAVSNGVPSADWFPLSARVFDLDGHELMSNAVDWIPRAKGWGIAVEPAPWAGQLWRLQVAFSRNSAFGPEEQVSLRGLRIAGRTWVPLEEQLSVGDRKLEVRGLRYARPKDWEWDIDARLIRRESGVSLTLVEARDQQGRKLRHHPRHRTFRAWPDSETIDLTFAVHPHRYAEFLAEPVDVMRR